MKMRPFRFHTIAIITSVTVLSGCGAKAHYNGLIASQRIECQSLPNSQYEDCMAATQKSYEEYERERQEAKKEH